MNDFKAVKKIVHLANYDFQNNLSSWLFITGFYASLVMISFTVVCFALDSFDMAYWGWVSNFFFDWITSCYALLSGEVGVVGQVLAWYTILFFVLLPLGMIKNSLDLAFDSAMSGIVFNDISALTIARYGAVFVGGHGAVVAFVATMLIGVGYFLRPEYPWSRFVFHSVTYGLLCIAAYLLLLVYLLCMHIVEYKNGLCVSVQDFYAMLVGRHLLVMQVLGAQAFVALSAFLFLHYLFGFLLDFPVNCIIWVFEILKLNVNPIFIYMLYNFFYVWAYLMVYAALALLAAHLYRQLICPPVQNVSCTSCSSCETQLLEK